MKKIYLAISCFCLIGFTAKAQYDNNPGANHGNKFEQLGTMISDPNMYRSASGAPGPKYWQQRADYEINANLNDDKQRLDGTETITYYNNSPDPLTYLWLQLDENQHRKDSQGSTTGESKMQDKMSLRQLQSIMGNNLDLGDHVLSVKDANGTTIPFTINETMMRLELPKTLQPGEKFKFKVAWFYNISDRRKKCLHSLFGIMIRHPIFK